MTTTAIEAKPLPLKNVNNCLASSEMFNYIHFAPKESIAESKLDAIYYTETDGHHFYSQIVDIYRIEFFRLSMSTVITGPATGMESHEWAAWWMEQFPETRPDTKMAVYTYKKIKI